MGIYDRDYMRRDDRPPPPAGGRTGFVIFLLIMLALAIAFHRAHPQFFRDYVQKPWSAMMKRFGNDGNARAVRS